jgi:hypothetical protein
VFLKIISGADFASIDTKEEHINLESVSAIHSLLKQGHLDTMDMAIIQ